MQKRKAFYNEKTGEEYTTYTVDEEAAGEEEATKNLIAAEHNLSPEDIKTRVEERAPESGEVIFTYYNGERCHAREVKNLHLSKDGSEEYVGQSDGYNIYKVSSSVRFDPFGFIAVRA